MDQSCGIPITTVCCSNLNLKSTPPQLGAWYLYTYSMAGKFGGEFKFGNLQPRSWKKWPLLLVLKYAYALARKIPVHSTKRMRYFSLLEGNSCR